LCLRNAHGCACVLFGRTAGTRSLAHSHSLSLIVAPYPPVKRTVCMQGYPLALALAICFNYGRKAWVVGRAGSQLDQTLLTLHRSSPSQASNAQHRSDRSIVLGSAIIEKWQAGTKKTKESFHHSHDGTMAAENRKTICFFSFYFFSSKRTSERASECLID